MKFHMSVIRSVFPLVFAVCTLALASNVLAQTKQLSDEQMEELVRRSYQYVAMFNVNNKFALDVNAPMNTGGWNRTMVNTALADHRLEAIARPNNDTLYAGAMIDVTKEPMVLRIPAFDSKYLSLMVTGYDHYVNVPMSTRLGDFGKSETMLFYSARTPGYKGQSVKGVDRIFEVTGDFVSAIFRVMPHAAEPSRMEINLAAMQKIDLVPLSEFQSGKEADSNFLPWSSPIGIARDLSLKEDVARFPPFGSDVEIFEERLLEVMQFVFNHTTFDRDDPLDAALLAIYKPLGVVPGKKFDPDTVANLDGQALRIAAERVAREVLDKFDDPAFSAANITKLFQPKGQMDLTFLTLQSVVGPIGLPASEAVYPPISTKDGTSMNAMFDYEIVMAPQDMPPATAFWSATLYDNARGFFIPNDRFKYSVGENSGFKLNDNGGIRIVISAEKPDGVAEDNWLPINRGDYDIGVIMRLYAPDLERFSVWTPPVAKRLD